jgi:hypothetical protein
MRGKLARALPAAFVVLAGCFSYRTIDDASPAPPRATPIRVYLKTPASIPLMDATVNNVVQVDGEFVGWQDGDLTLSATWLRVANGLDHKAVGETVVLTPDQVDRVERKVLSAPKTAGLIGISALASALAGVAFTGGASGSGPGGPPPVSK